MRPWHAAGILSVACMSVLGVGQVAAQSPTGALPLMAVQGTVVLGYAEDAPPFSVAQPSGVPVGYSLDWCHAIVAGLRTALGKPHLKVKYVPVGQDQMARVVASGGVHLMCAAVSATPERRLTMRFSEPVFISATKFMVRTQAGITTPSQLAGKRVAVLGRTSTEAAVKDFAQRQGVKLVISPVLNADAALSQLNLRQVDAWARDESLLLGVRARQAKPSDWVVLPDEVATQPIAIAFANDADLQRVVDVVMAEQVRSGAAEALYNTWFVKANALFPQGLSMPLPTNLTQAWQSLR